MHDTETLTPATAQSRAHPVQHASAQPRAHVASPPDQVQQRLAAERAFWADIEASPQLRSAMDAALEQGEGRGHLMVRFDPWVDNTTRAECFHNDCGAEVVITVSATGLQLAGRAIDHDCNHVEEEIGGAAEGGPTGVHAS